MKGRGASGRFQKAQGEDQKVSTKVSSPGCFLLQYRTDGANDVTIWRKRLSVVANRECPTIGRVIDELEYRLPEEVERPDFAAIKDEDDKFIARSIYLKKLEENLNMLAEMERERSLSCTH